MLPDQYNWCLTVFFFTYAAFEVPSNLLLKRLRPSIWLPTIMVAWGVVMTLMGIVQSYHGLLVARIFLGVTEAGLFPGVAVSWKCPLQMPSLILSVLFDHVVLPTRNPVPPSPLFLSRLHRRCL